MTELSWFFIIGLFAVGSAIAMLMSDNAVHSALFLIVTMACIAFLFLLLSAPFLAMVQITVYTGAIMVLFVFVIMLLGSERMQTRISSPDKRRFPWYTALAVGLVFALLLIVGIVVTQVNLDLLPNPAGQPQVRVLNAAPDAGTVDVFANDQLIASGVGFNSEADYISLSPGDYTIRVQPVNGTALTTDVSLAEGTQQTLVDYGDPNDLRLSVVADDNSTVENRSGRLTFLNGYDGTVQVVDFGSDFDANDTKVIVQSLEPGQVSAPLVWEEGTINWAFVDAADINNVLYRLRDYDLQRDTSGLVVLTQERVFAGESEGELRVVALPLVLESRPSFGGPRAIGLQLFTNYMLVFQLLAVLLLAAMVGVIVLTHREMKKSTQRMGGRRRVSRPLVNVIAAQVGHDVTSSGENVPELQEPVGE